MTISVRCFAPLLASLVFGLGCSSSSSSGANDGGGGGGGSGSGSGSGSSSGGESGGACALLTDAGPFVCVVTRINGMSNVVDQAGCTPTMSTYFPSCPTTSLVGCCTAPVSVGAGSANEEECFYNLEEPDGAVVCPSCGENSTGFNTQAEVQAACMDGGAGYILTSGTWSTTP
jgi:hypothetical protein